MKRNDIDNGMLTYSLGEDVTAFTTDRTVGRDADKIKEIIGAKRNVPADALRFTRPHQTHGDRIMPVAEEFFSLPDSTRKMLMEGVDAVMTNVPDIIIGVSTADCIPVLVYDPEHHAAAAIHAGWRGTVQRIVLKTMQQMVQMYHTNPAMCKAAIGPGISLDSFEVGDEVYNDFVEAQFPMDTVAKQYHVMTTNGQQPTTTQPDNQTTKPLNNQTTKQLNNQTTKQLKWHLDLKEINRQLLLATGIPAESITVSDIDTLTDTRFFSARREQKGDVKCGRIFSGSVFLSNR